jgi:hypothetical protein
MFQGRMTEKMRDADIEIAMECAEVAEREMCVAMHDTIESMCVSPHQKMLASALVSAVIIEKLDGATIVGGPEFTKTVTQLREKMRPDFQERARIRRGERNKERAKEQPKWRQFFDANRDTIWKVVAYVFYAWALTMIIWFAASGGFKS